MASARNRGLEGVLDLPCIIGYDRPSLSELFTKEALLPQKSTDKGTRVTDTLPKHYRRNFWCFVLDFGLFGTALAFIGQSTVIPGFLTALGASSAMIGLMSSLHNASWLLPQLFAARAVADKPYKKPYILRPAAAGRVLLLFLALALWITGAQPTWLMLLITAVVIIGFWIGDGLASVPWFDLFSKAIPARRRGRMIGIGQALSGTLGFLAGIVVEWLLGDRGLPYPSNYAWLFTLAFVTLALSFAATASIIEPRGATASQPPGWKQFVPQLRSVLKDDHAFRRFIIARQLFSLAGLATPFYMTYALTQLNLPAQVAGRYTSISVVGSIVAAVAFGWVNERYGSKRVIQISIGLATSVPLIALIVPRLLTTPASLAWGYSLVFLVMSATMSSMMSGWMAFVLEYAPDQERPTYVGLTNTLNGIATLFSTLGGLILQWTNDNYNALFLITFLGLLLAWPLPFGLPEPRQRASTQT
jgi:MFS family permease